MNTRIFLGLTLLACFTSKLFALTPIQEAKNHLERAIGLLNKKDEGAGKKRKTSIPNILSVLTNTEQRLNEVNSNKGTNTNAALKFVAEAKAELEAAKNGEADHLDKAEAALQEAMKRVMQIIHINKS